MKIHSSAKFEGIDIPFHDEFEVNLTMTQISENKEKIANLAVKNFKKKCDKYFKIEFSTMIFFEVYVFSQLNEYKIFKKEKIL